MDFDRVGLLLNICDLANKWPKLKALHDEAMGELEKIMQDRRQPYPETKVATTAQNYTSQTTQDKRR